MSQGSDPNRPSPTGRPSPFPGVRVLAVEDHAIGRVLLDAMLGGLGIAVTLVESGEEAREAIRRAEFDVVLVDLGLPDIGGETLAREIARMTGDHAPAIVAVTGRARPQAMPQVFTEWLEKPFSVADLHRLFLGLRGRMVRSA